MIPAPVEAERSIKIVAKIKTIHRCLQKSESLLWLLPSFLD